jgi:hypothetical protein
VVTIRSALRIATLSAATAGVVVMAEGCSAGATTPRTAVSRIPPAPQRAVRIYPVGALIVDVTARLRPPIDSHGADPRLAQREEGLEEAR